MATTITTVSVHAERAEALREYRDEHELPSMDAALEQLLSDRGERSHS
ncbi:hypothetical protein [Halobacterium salinarum]|jgi:hypothetical protein|nr:hypothetical protein [Halobacterium salinarum]MDL0123513.1 hypothetical protein [Halobacterium salinarum]